MLLGEYEHTIDDKNRLTLPAKFRQAFEDGVVLAKGIDACVEAYTRADFEKVVRRVGELDRFRGKARQIQRLFFAGAADQELDRQGRVMIPSSLMRYAGLEREVVVAGVLDHLEIWDRAAWQRELKDVEGSAEHVAERLAADRD